MHCLPKCKKFVLYSSPPAGASPVRPVTSPCLELTAAIISGSAQRAAILIAPAAVVRCPTWNVVCTCVFLSKADVIYVYTALMSVAFIRMDQITSYSILQYYYTGVKNMKEKKKKKNS